MLGMTQGKTNVPELKTKIGLEIHVQLKTKTKMFCRCNNEAFQAKPNTIICPICLGMPGSLPVANKEAILSTIKTGLKLNCEIPKIAKFDRKHYFYPDLPKGYQISQYDEPFCAGGYLEIDGAKVRLNRIHLEEDAGKLVHLGGKSLVDLNRAGTPLMEIVTEPDITSPLQAGELLRKLQKIVRDVVGVSEASMEKGHMRCDANISVSDESGKMSQIVELKNLNSFRFVEKALKIEEEKLKESYFNWPEKLTKATHGYDSKKNETYVQRIKEEAADYRYFPEPDLPPFDTSEFDLESLRLGMSEGEDAKIASLVDLGVADADAKILVSNKIKGKIFEKISARSLDKVLTAKVIVHNYFGFSFDNNDIDKAGEYARAIEQLSSGKIQKNNFMKIVGEIHKSDIKFDEAFSNFSAEGGKLDLNDAAAKIIEGHAAEAAAYRSGKTQLLGFFMGEIMKETKGRANPGEASHILKEMLER